MSKKRRIRRKINGRKKDHSGQIVAFDEKLQLGLIQAEGGKEIIFKPSECYGIGTPIIPQPVLFKLAKKRSKLLGTTAVDIRPVPATLRSTNKSNKKRKKFVCLCSGCESGQACSVARPRGDFMEIGLRLHGSFCSGGG